MKNLKYLLFAIIPVLLFTSKVSAVSIEMYQDQQMTALGYKECVLAKCWDRYRNVKYDGQLASLNFYSPLTISPLEKYTLTINFRGDDFISAKANTVSVNNNTECSIISTQTDGNEYSTYLKIAFVCGQSSDWFHVNVGGLGDEDYITGGPSSGTTTYGITSLDIVNETAKDTEKIIAGNDKNTDNIINNNDKNTNTIIDKNKENTDKILDSNKDTQNVIKDQFNSCRDSVNLVDFSKNAIINGVNYSFDNNSLIITQISSVQYSSLSFSILDIIKNNPGKTLKFVYTDLDVSSFNSSMNTIVQLSLKNNGTSIYFNMLTSENGHAEYTIPQDTSGFTFAGIKFYTNNSKTTVDSSQVTITKPMLVFTDSVYTDYEQYGQQICSNKLDEQNKTSKGILGKLSSLFDWLTNKDSADVSGANKIAGYLPPGPLDSIINLPLTFFQNVNTNLSKTCTPLDVPIPYLNKTIQIPCINTIFNQIDGLPNLWNWTGTIMSIFILYRYLIALYKYYDDLTTLKANFISDWGSI